MAHSNLGVALQARGRLDEAIACFRKAIELDPKFAMAHNNLGVALRDQGKLDEAIACYRKAIELDPKYAVPTTTSASPWRIRGSWTRPSPATARPSNSTRNTPMAHNNLGVALEDQGKLDEAIACLPQGHRTRPETRRVPQ